MNNKKAPKKELHDDLNICANEIAVKLLVDALKKTGAISEKCVFITKKENQQYFEDAMNDFVNNY